MTKATAAITHKFKNTFVQTNGRDTTELQQALFKMGFKWWNVGGRGINKDAINSAYIRVDGDCEIYNAKRGNTPEANQVYGYTEVSWDDVIEAAEQVRKIKREEGKASKKRRAQRKWDATATQHTGHTRPVAQDAVVSVKLVCGLIRSGKADALSWVKWDWTSDIESYKVITNRKPKAKPDTRVSVDEMFGDIAESLGKGVAFTPVGDVPDTNPKRQYGVSSIPLNMWSPLASAYGSLGLYNGSLKYGKANFANTPVEASIYIAAAMRHLNAWAAGQEDDPADGVPNLGGVLANIAILLEARAGGMLIDDRLLMAGYLSEIDMLKAKVKALNELHTGKNPKHYTREG